MPDDSLAGCTVLVTRPRDRADGLIRRLTDAGARVEHFPTIEITPPEFPLSADSVRSQLEQCDIAIFISRNAAIYGLPLVRASGGWPDGIRIAAVGSGTASELASLGSRVDFVPGTGASSEALLDALASEEVDGRNIVIFRGNGGRELLAESLRSRGAQVTYLECYRRSLPDIDAQVLSELWAGDGIDAVIAASSEGLNNLNKLVKELDKPRLQVTQVYVVSRAMVELCGDLGYNKVVLMDSPRDDDVLAALKKHCRHAQ